MKIPHDAYYDIAMAAGKDAANRSMRAAGRTSWNEDDYNEAVKETDRLMSLFERSADRKLKSETGGLTCGLIR